MQESRVSRLLGKSLGRPRESGKTVSGSRLKPHAALGQRHSDTRADGFAVADVEATARAEIVHRFVTPNVGNCL